MTRFFLYLFHESNQYVLLSGQGTLLVPQANGGGILLGIFTPKELLCFGCLWPKFSDLPFFGLKQITDPKWLALFASPTKCNLQGFAITWKH